MSWKVQIRGVQQQKWPDMSQEVQVIAEIPQDILGLSGKILSSDVYGFSGTRKRIQSELALAIDHQGLNIYDV